METEFTLLLLLSQSKSYIATNNPPVTQFGSSKNPLLWIWILFVLIIKTWKHYLEWTVTLSWALGSPSRTCLSDSDFCLWFTNNLEIIIKHWITTRQQALFSMQWHCPQTDHAFFNFCCPSFFLLLLCLCCHCSCNFYTVLSSLAAFLFTQPHVSVAYTNTEP